MSEDKDPHTPSNITIYMPSLSPRRRRNRLNLDRIVTSVMISMALLLGFAPFIDDFKAKFARKISSPKALFSLTSKQSAQPQGAKEANPAKTLSGIASLFHELNKPADDTQQAKRVGEAREANDDPAKALNGIASLLHELNKQAGDAQQAKGAEDNPAETTSAIASLLDGLGEQSDEAQEAKQEPSQAASIIKQLRAQNPNWKGHRPDSHCHSKPVMTDQDFRACNISAPAPIRSNH